MIHSAKFGSIERFFGVLVEHYAGAFPPWLAPVQVQGIPIAERHNDYLYDVAKRMKAAGLRVEVDDSDDRMQKKIRNAQLQKVPFMVIAGDDDVEAGAVSFRYRDGHQDNGVPIDEAIARVAAGGRVARAGLSRPVRAGRARGAGCWRRRCSAGARGGGGEPETTPGPSAPSAPRPTSVVDADRRTRRPRGSRRWPQLAEQAAAALPPPQAPRAARTRAGARRRRQLAAVPEGHGHPRATAPSGRRCRCREAEFVILGLTNGPGFTANPCLAEQVAWVRERRADGGGVRRGELARRRRGRASTARPAPTTAPPSSGRWPTPATSRR